jgi:hypothetical protein
MLPERFISKKLKAFFLTLYLIFLIILMMMMMMMMMMIRIGLILKFQDKS